MGYGELFWDSSHRFYDVFSSGCGAQGRNPSLALPAGSRDIASPLDIAIQGHVQLARRHSRRAPNTLSDVADIVVLPFFTTPCFSVFFRFISVFSSAVLFRFLLNVFLFVFISFLAMDQDVFL